MEKTVTKMGLETLATPVPPSPEGTLPEDCGVASKDVTLDPNLDLWLRIFLPITQPVHNERMRMPVFLYFHGGAFIMGSPAWRCFHTLCIRMATAARAIVVSVNYRLAPKHRLPAAYDDCLTALSWLRSEATNTDYDNGRDGDPWLQSHADFSRVFLVGDSSGGNIVHQVIVKGRDWNPLKIRGAVMVQPSFGGEQRTQSEIESLEDLERSVRSRMMALPEGVDKDHPFSNPLAASSDYPTLAKATLPPLLIVVGGRDMLRDRAKAYYESLVKHGKAAEMIVFEEENHGFYALKQDAESTETLIQHITHFVQAKK
jgi:acetyl esterase/lipase